MQFVDRLRDALNRHLFNEDAKLAVLTNLAIENATSDCKKILMALP